MNTINHMKWAMGEREYLRDVQTAAAPIPYPTERTPQEEIEVLQAKIADEQETIRAFGSSRIARDAQGRVNHYETEIQKWQAAIYAADQEAFDRRMKASAVYPMFETRRAEFIKQVQKVAQS